MKRGPDTQNSREIAVELGARGYYVRVTKSGHVIGGVELTKGELDIISGAAFTVSLKTGQCSVWIWAGQKTIEFTTSDPTEAVEKIHAEVWPHFVLYWHRRIADELKARGWKIGVVSHTRVSAAGSIDRSEPFDFMYQPIFWMNITEQGWYVSILPDTGQISHEHHNLSFEEVLEIIGWNTTEADRPPEL